MLRPLKVLFSPDREWEKAALDRPSAAIVLLISFLPWLVLCLGVEGYGLWRLGERIGDFRNVQIPDPRILRYCVFYGVGSFLVVCGGAQLLRTVGESFNLNVSFGTCFILVALTYMPILFLRMADGLPQINTWICWAVGIALAVRILYHGVALWLQPEQTKGFGILLVTAIYITVLSGLVHFASVQVLHGKLLNPVPARGAGPAQAH
jgi:hypothetical protein